MSRVFVLIGIIIGRVFCESGKCGTKLLNDYNKVPDTAFSATSHFIHPDQIKKKTDFSAKAARESYDKENQEFAWCPLNQVDTSLSEYLEIDLGRLTMVKVVQTKGRFAQGAGKEFTPYYRIRYSRDSGQHWRDYKKFKDKGFQELLNGPNDAFLDAFETLNPPIVAKVLRIFPYSPKSKRVCLKLQLFGCDFTNDLLEYQMIQGTPAIITNSVLASQSMKSLPDTLYPCLDNGYDGHYYDGRLQNGLGLLTDNDTGEPLTNKSKELFDFVGWHKDSLNQRKDFISIEFVFINSRNFSSVKIYSYSNPSMKVGYINKIVILFSDDGRLYNREFIISDLLSKLFLQDQFIDINLRGHFGRFVKINFYFKSEWLLLSEIIFDSISRHIGINKKENKKYLHDKLKITNFSSVSSTVTVNNAINPIITTTSSKYLNNPVSLEIIYLLSILLCLLLGVITAICSFWIIIRRKRSQRKKVIKKQALALCSQSSFIPYTHNSNSLQCLANALPSVVLPPRGNYPSYTVDRRNYSNGTLRTVNNISSGFHSHNSILDQNGIANKHCNGDTNIYTSIVGSDNDSSLSPEYATTSIMNDPQTYADTPTSYLPPPIEPIRSDGYNDSFRNNSNRQSLYYPHPSTLPNPQESSNIWRINGIHKPDFERSDIPQNQKSFNDFSYYKYNHSNLQDNYGSNSSSKYTDSL